MYKYHTIVPLSARMFFFLGGSTFYQLSECESKSNSKCLQSINTIWNGSHLQIHTCNTSVIKLLNWLVSIYAQVLWLDPASKLNCWLYMYVARLWLTSIQDNVIVPFSVYITLELSNCQTKPFVIGQDWHFISYFLFLFFDIGKQFDIGKCLCWWAFNRKLTASDWFNI